MASVDIILGQNYLFSIKRNIPVAMFTGDNLIFPRIAR
jgi:hypothetical protein